MSAREFREPRAGFPWFLLTGLVLGLILGLVYAWWINPVTYRESAPDVLSAEQKDQYFRLIALAYASNHDAGRSAARLALLGEKDPASRLAALAQQVAVEGGSGDEARALAALAAALRALPAAEPTKTATTTSTGAEASMKSQVLAVTETKPAQDGKPTATPPADAVRSATPVPVPTGTPVPAATFTPRPTATASPTSGPPFVLGNTEVLCADASARGLLQVQVNDSAGQAVPGMTVVITWDGGQERFYTGLAPDISPGYADYQMETGVEYSVRVGEGGEAVGGIGAPECKSGGGNFYGGVRLTFKQP